MHIDLRVTYEQEPDKFFWLREAADGSGIDALRQRVAALYGELSPRAFMLLDAAVAGETAGAEAVRAAIPTLPEYIAGIPVRTALARLAEVLAEAPAPPAERQTLVEAALASIDKSKLEAAIAWVAEALGFRFGPDASLAVEVYAVASGVPLGGLTGFRIDDSPICFVSVQGQEGSTFAEVIIHEATHVLDVSCDSTDSLVERLRLAEPSLHQLWHAPYFIAAAEATRRFVDASHRDFGDTHGYYAKVPNELARLNDEGIIDAIRNR